MNLYKKIHKMINHDSKIIEGILNLDLLNYLIRDINNRRQTM